MSENVNTTPVEGNETGSPVSENVTTVAVADPAVAEPAAPAVARNKYATEKKKHKLPKWIKWSIVLLILAGVSYGIYYLVTTLIKKEEIPVQTSIVTRGQLATYISGYGSVVPKQKSEYGAKTRGVVTDVFVKSGDLVKPGDILFSIDPTELQKELDIANDAKRVAYDRLKATQNDINSTTVKAPFNGKLITTTEYKKGQTIAAGAPIGTLVDDSKLALTMYFSYAYIDDITAGMTANISVPQSMTQVSGTVESVDKIKKITAEGSTLFRVNIVLTNPGSLTEGAIASASISTAKGDAMPADTGKLEYINKEELKAKVGGDVAYVDIMEYGEYANGQTILTLSGDGLQDAYNTAQKAYNDAVTKADEIATNMANTDIIADIEGMVSAVLVEVGKELTASGTAVLSVSNTTSLFVEINIDELDVSKISVGMPVEVSYNNGTENVPVPGTISEISFEAKKQESGNPWGGGAVAYFPAKIAIENTGLLLPNMGVDYKITSVVKEDCLLVSSAAVVFTDTGTIAYVKEESITPEAVLAEVPPESVPKGFVAVIVEAGLSDASNTEIISGLWEGAEVSGAPINPDGGMNPGMGGGSIMIG